MIDYNFMDDFRVFVSGLGLIVYWRSYGLMFRWILLIMKSEKISEIEFVLYKPNFMFIKKLFYFLEF